MNRDIVDSSVIAAYIKRFREQPPASESDRIKMGSKETFWWQTNKRGNRELLEDDLRKNQVVDERPSSCVLDDLNLSDIRISHSSVGSDGVDLGALNHTKSGIDDYDDTSVSELADRLVQKCERLLLGSKEVLIGSTEEDIPTARFSISASTSTQSDESQSIHSSSDSFQDMHAKELGVHSVLSFQSDVYPVHCRDSYDARPKESPDDESVANSSVFYALSPSTSCLSSVQICSDALIPPTLNHGSIPEVSDNLHMMAEITRPETDISNERKHKDFGNVSYSETTRADQHMAQQQQQQQGQGEVVDGTFVFAYLGNDPAVSELWQRLCHVREEAFLIKQVLDGTDTF